MHEVRNLLQYFKSNLDDPIEWLNPEVTFITMTRQLLNRFGESNIDYVYTRTFELVGKLIHTYRERAQKVHRTTNFVLPDSVKHLPYLIYCLRSTELFARGKKRHEQRVECLRRQFMRVEPLQFMLHVVPVVYCMNFYNEEGAGNSEGFILPPPVPPSLYNLQKSRKLS